LTSGAVSADPCKPLDRSGRGSRWRRGCSPPSARARCSSLGRQDLATFTGDPACAALDLLARHVDPPQGPLTPQTQVRLARGPYTLDGERPLLLAHRADVLVTRDSGDEATDAKLHAAHDLALPVIMINRPPAPATSAVATVAQA